MDKNAEFIRKKEFHIVFKGYKPEEVDKFLDILSVEFDRLIKKNKELQESLDRLKFESTEEETDIKKVIQDALVSAHKVAEEIKSAAKKEAEELIERKKQDEEKTLSDMQMKKLQLEESMLVLQSKYDELKDKIKKMLEDFNQYISEIDAEYFGGTKSLITGVPEKEDHVPVETESEEAHVTSGEEQILDQDNYKINQERDSGFYFIRDQRKEESKEKEKEKEKEKDEIPDVEQKPQEPESENDTVQKRQRKKIDIANPDIIENFFKASND